MNGYTILTEVYVYNPAEEQVAGPFDTEEQAEEWCRNAEPWGAGRDPYGRPDPREHPEYWTE